MLIKGKKFGKKFMFYIEDKNGNQKLLLAIQNIHMGMRDVEFVQEKGIHEFWYKDIKMCCK